jgi:alpha-ketoglutarate-dependent taurine dioxygenase
MITAAPLAPIGAEITDIDGDALLHGPSIAAEILDLLEQRGVLVFPEPGLDDAQQAARARRLGEHVVRDSPGYGGEYPEIFKAPRSRAQQLRILEGHALLARWRFSTTCCVARPNGHRSTRTGGGSGTSSSGIVAAC